MEGLDGIYQRVTLRPAPISPLSSLPSLTTVNDYTIQTSTKRLTISLVSNSITIFPFLICTCICICSILHRLNSSQLDRRDELVYAANPTIPSTSPFFHDNNSTQLNSVWPILICISFPSPPISDSSYCESTPDLCERSEIHRNTDFEPRQVPASPRLQENRLDASFITNALCRNASAAF
jgi:hypothetical protein